MLHKSERLSRTQFDHYFKTGARLHAPYAQLIYAKSDVFHGSAVVGKKVYKSAVMRNRLRRRLYGLLYTQVRTLPVPYTCILIARPELAKLSRKEASSAVRALLEKLPKA